MTFVTGTTVVTASLWNMRILSRHRIGNRFFERFYAMPLVCRAHAAVAPDLIHTPINFQRMIVRIAKLHGDLTAGAPAAFKVDLSAAFTQAIARAKDFGERRHLESEVMQFSIRVLAVTGSDESKAMMVCVAA